MYKKYINNLSLPIWLGCNLFSTTVCRLYSLELYKKASKWNKLKISMTSYFYPTIVPQRQFKK